MLNLVVVVGRLVRPMTCERTPAGPYACRLALNIEDAGAVGPGRGGGVWIDVWYLAPRPVDVPADLRVGEPVLVEGRLQIRRYRDRDGRPCVVPAVLARRVKRAAGPSPGPGSPLG